MKSLISNGMLRTLKELAASSPDGAMVEIGVYQGGSAAELYEVAERQNRALYLYDTFCGCPVAQDIDRHKIGEFADCSSDAVRTRLPNAHVVAGVFPDSLIDMPPVAFVHADADQYDSTKAICELMPSCMVSGGIIVFDDYCLAGCAKAVNEAFPDREILPDGRAFVRVSNVEI